MRFSLEAISARSVARRYAEQWTVIAKLLDDALSRRHPSSVTLRFLLVKSLWYLVVVVPTRTAATTAVSRRVVVGHKDDDGVI